jgi:hypothetical protein
MPSHDRAAILLLSGTLALTNVACSQVNSLWRSNESAKSQLPSSTPSPAANLPDNLSQWRHQQQTLQLQPRKLMNGHLMPPTVLLPLVSLPNPPTIGNWSSVAGKRRLLYYGQYRLQSLSCDRPIENRTISAQSGYSPTTSHSSPPQFPFNNYSGNGNCTPARLVPPARISVPSVSPSSTKRHSTPASTTNIQSPILRITIQQVFKVPIKRRAGRTPVVDVTFNGNKPSR